MKAKINLIKSTNSKTYYQFTFIDLQFVNSFQVFIINITILNILFQVLFEKDSNNNKTFSDFLLFPFYLILKRNMVKKLKNKHGEQFVDDVMETFGIPTNFMEKIHYGIFKTTKN